MRLRSGKLPHSVLKKAIAFQGAKDPRVLLGPRVGEDAAVIDLGEERLILKSDPITYAVDEIGWYAVHINANDVATMGAKPLWFQACLLLPRGTTENGVQAIMRDIDRACRELGVAVTGGHTEINPWIDRPIVVGDMHGMCGKKELVLSSGARVGDLMILTKGAGIEGTATLAREMKRMLSKRFSRAFLRRAENYLYVPGISVVREALMGAEMGATAMHDPTEGGVAIGIYELATVSGKGVLIDRDEIIVRDETAKLCEFFDIDPLGLLGSGALLVTLPPRKADHYLDRLADMDIDASVIGRMTRSSEGLKLSVDGRKRALRYSQRDEILKVL